ncbi:MAG: hypothetical protein WCQ47_03470 [bacterium]
MRHFIYLTLMLCSLNAFSQAEIPTQQELCGVSSNENKVIYNYEHHFGKFYDQANTGSCYALSVAALLEEDNYLRYIGKVPSSFFENNISAIDIQRCDMKTGHGLGYVGNNDYAFFAMECALYDSGACFDTYAVFNTASKWSLTTQKGRFEDFMTAYDEWTTFNTQGNRTEAERTNFIYEKTKYFWKYLPNDEKAPYTGQAYSLAHFMRAFYDAKNRVDFLNLMLTTDKCKKNRNLFSNREFFSTNYYKKNNSSSLLYKKEKIDIIKEAFTKKRSSIVILFGNSLTHAAIVTGMRMQDGLCQLRLRSSLETWGKNLTSNGWFNDWYNADSLLESTLAIKNLKEVSSQDYEASKKIFLQKDIANIYKQENLYNDASKW